MRAVNSYLRFGGTSWPEGFPKTSVAISHITWQHISQDCYCNII